jgi:hypothetical protein
MDLKSVVSKRRRSWVPMLLDPSIYGKLRVIGNDGR